MKRLRQKRGPGVRAGDGARYAPIVPAAAPHGPGRRHGTGGLGTRHGWLVLALVLGGVLASPGAAGTLQAAVVEPLVVGSAAGQHGTIPSFPYAVTGLTRIAQLIGSPPHGPSAGRDPSPHAINDTTRWGICGGDLGSLIYADGVAYIALGDNYTTCPPGSGGPAPASPPDWRSNAVGIIADPGNFKHGLRITRWVSRDGHHASEVIASQHDAGDCQNTATAGCEVTRIPTYGFATQGRLFLAFMSVHHWGDAGQWDVNYSSLAMSTNRGKTWTVETPRITWGARSNFAQVAVTPDPEGTHLLFYGIPAGRFGAARLMRVPRSWASVLTPHSYQYFAGTDRAGAPRWSSAPGHAIVVAQAPVGELSVIYNPGLKRWLMTYLQGGGDLVIRTAAHYWGPWSEPCSLATQQEYPGLYGAYMNPHFLADNGRTIYFVMSQWGPYRIFWMRATLGGTRCAS